MSANYDGAFHLYAIRKGDKWWTQAGGFGKLPKFYPFHGRAVQAVKYRPHEMTGAEIVPFMCFAPDSGCSKEALAREFSAANYQGTEV